MDSILKKYTINDLLSGDPTDQTEAAFFLVNEKLSREDVFKLLQSGNNELASYAVTQLDNVTTQEEALILTSCLKYEDSRITDPVSTMIKNLVISPKFRGLFIQDEVFEILIGYISASNPRVCRNIGEILFSAGCSRKTIKRIVRICFQELEKKNNFALYWSLFSLEQAVSSLDNINDTDILELLSEISSSREYQIRERAAFLVKIINTKLSNPVLSELHEKLKQDDNFYVRNIAK